MLLHEINRAERGGWKMPSASDILQKYAGKAGYYYHITRHLTHQGSVDDEGNTDSNRWKHVQQKSKFQSVKVGMNPNPNYLIDNSIGIYAFPFSDATKEDLANVKVGANQDRMRPEQDRIICVVKFNGKGRRLVTSTYTQEQLEIDALHLEKMKQVSTKWREKYIAETDESPLVGLYYMLWQQNEKTVGTRLRKYLNVGMIDDDLGEVLDPDNGSLEAMFTSKQSVTVVECAVNN